LEIEAVAAVEEAVASVEVAVAVTEVDEEVVSAAVVEVVTVVVLEAASAVAEVRGTFCFLAQTPADYFLQAPPVAVAEVVGSPSPVAEVAEEE
jgi:hypothetical protein